MSILDGIDLPYGNFLIGSENVQEIFIGNIADLVFGIYAFSLEQIKEILD